MGDAGLTWADFVAGWDDVFRDPVIAGVVGGLALGYLGVFIVLRRMVFVSAAVTSSAGLGVAFAFYLGIHHATHIDPVYSAVAFSVLTMLLFVGEGRRFRMSRESLLGLVFALAGGVTLLIEARISQEAHDIHSILFGDAVLVRPFDFKMILGVGLGLLALHAWAFRGISFAVFDTATARVQGLPVRLLNAFVLISIGLMVGVAARALGALPVFALSTLPAIAALALGLRLPWTGLVAALFGAAAGGGGYLLATFRDLPVGGSQTTAAGAITIVVVAAVGAIRLVQRGLGKRARGGTK